MSIGQASFWPNIRRGHSCSELAHAGVGNEEACKGINPGGIAPSQALKELVFRQALWGWLRGGAAGSLETEVPAALASAVLAVPVPHEQLNDEQRRACWYVKDPPSAKPVPTAVCEPVATRTYPSPHSGAPGSGGCLPRSTGRVTYEPRGSASPAPHRSARYCPAARSRPSSALSTARPSGNAAGRLRRWDLHGFHRVVHQVYLFGRLGDPGHSPRVESRHSA